MIIGHIDQVQDLEYSMAAARRGVFVEYDAWGREYYREEWGWNFVMGQDAWRVRYVKELVEAGFGDQLLFAQDVCFKTDLRAYGGWGYAHILNHIVPMLLDIGVPRGSDQLAYCRTIRRARSRCARRATDGPRAMEIIDLTRPMTHQTLIELGGRRVNEGWATTDVVVTWQRDWRQGDNGAQCQWQLGDHWGTHVDAPIHVVRDAPSVDQMDLQRLMGEAVVLDCRFARGRGLTGADFEAARPGVQAWRHRPHRTATSGPARWIATSRTRRT